MLLCGKKIHSCCFSYRSGIASFLNFPEQDWHPDILRYCRVPFTDTVAWSPQIYSGVKYVSISWRHVRVFFFLLKKKDAPILISKDNCINHVSFHILWQEQSQKPRIAQMSCESRCTQTWTSEEWNPKRAVTSCFCAVILTVFLCEAKMVGRTLPFSSFY